MPDKKQLSQLDTLMPILREFVLSQTDNFNVNQLVYKFKQTAVYKKYVLKDITIRVYLSETCLRLESEQPPKLEIVTLQPTRGIPRKVRRVI